MGTDSVIVCEGPETGLALHEALGRDVLAVGGTSGFAAVEISKEVSTVIFAADHDANGAGERAARTAAQQHHDSGKTVHVVIPEQPGDWLDVLNQGGPGPFKTPLRTPRHSSQRCPLGRRSRSRIGSSAS
jgi:DNA primase